MEALGVALSVLHVVLLAYIAHLLAKAHAAAAVPAVLTAVPAVPAVLTIAAVAPADDPPVTAAHVEQAHAFADAVHDDADLHRLVVAQKITQALALQGHVTTLEAVQRKLRGP